MAAKIGLPPEQVLETLAVHGDWNGIYLAAFPPNQELDFKELAHQVGDRNVENGPLEKCAKRDWLYSRGVTAHACKKDYPVFIDELAEICDVISVYAGMRGLQVLLAPEHYIRSVHTRVVAIAKPK